MSGRIRKAEAALHYRRWSEAEDAFVQARDALEVAEQQANQVARLAAQASAAQAEAAAHLPDLRKSEAEAAAKLHRLEVARDTLEAEEQRLSDAIVSATAQGTEIDELLDNMVFLLDPSFNPDGLQRESAQQLHFQ